MEEKIEDYEIMNLPDARKRFDVVELSKKVKRKGDILILSNELKIKPRILNSVIVEGRVLAMFPKLEKSKAAILAGLKTDRELKLFSKKYDMYNVHARELIKLVRKWNHDITLNPLIMVNQQEHDLIIGTLLGDSSIKQRERNSCLRFSHSIKQRDYSRYKRNILQVFGCTEFREVSRKIKDHFIHAMDFATKVHPVFNYYRKLFYNEGRKEITIELLNQVTPRALAYWICDDGSFSKTQGYIILCTNSFTLEEHQLMKKFFNDRYGLDPTIGFRDGKYYYLRFKLDDSNKLIEIIKPFIPNCMKYKIGGQNG